MQIILYKLIKFLVNLYYKLYPFQTLHWGIDSITDIDIHSSEYHTDWYREGTNIREYDKINKFKEVPGG